MAKANRAKAWLCNTKRHGFEEEKWRNHVTQTGMTIGFGLRLSALLLGTGAQADSHRDCPTRAPVVLLDRISVFRAIKAHSCGTLSLAGHSCGTLLLPPKSPRHPNSHVKVSKTRVSCKTSFKSEAEVSSERTHQAALPSSFAHPDPKNQTPGHTQSHCHSDIHLYQTSQPHNSLRLPRRFNSTPPTRTASAASAASTAPATKM